VTGLQRRRVLTLAGLAALMAPRAARAHAVLLESTPPHDGTLPAGERTLVLRFNSRIDRGRSRLALVRPDKSEAVLALLPGSDDVLSATAVLAPGAHLLHWQVLALDGHITRGELAFTVAAP